MTHSLSTGRLSYCGSKELVGWEGGGGIVTYQGASSVALYNVFAFTSKHSHDQESEDNKIPSVKYQHVH